MAFPAAPLNGQVYVDPLTGAKYQYEAAVNAWRRAPDVAEVYFSLVDPTPAVPAMAQEGDEFYVTSDGTSAGSQLRRFIYDGAAWVQTPLVESVTFSAAAPNVVSHPSPVSGDEHYVTSNGLSTGIINLRYIYDGAAWTQTPLIDELDDLRDGVNTYALGTKSIGIGYPQHTPANMRQGTIVIGNEAALQGGGNFNTIIGTHAVPELSGFSDNNTVIGGNAAKQLGLMTTDGNTVVGASAATLMDGSYNTIIGEQAATTLIGGEDNIVIGRGAQTSAGNANNEITIGRVGMNRLRIPGLALDTAAALDGQYLAWDSTGGPNGGRFVWQPGGLVDVSSGQTNPPTAAATEGALYNALDTAGRWVSTYHHDGAAWTLGASAPTITFGTLTNPSATIPATPGAVYYTTTDGTNAGQVIYHWAAVLVGNTYTWQLIPSRPGKHRAHYRALFQVSIPASGVMNYGTSMGVNAYTTEMTYDPATHAAVIGTGLSNRLVQLTADFDISFVSDVANGRTFLYFTSASGGVYNSTLHAGMNTKGRYIAVGNTGTAPQWNPKQANWTFIVPTGGCSVFTMIEASQGGGRMEIGCGFTIETID